MDENISLMGRLISSVRETGYERAGEGKSARAKRREERAEGTTHVVDFNFDWLRERRSEEFEESRKHLMRVECGGGS